METPKNGGGTKKKARTISSFGCLNKFCRRSFSKQEDLQDHTARDHPVLKPFEFTPDQLKHLEKMFSFKKFINIFEIEKLSKMGNYPENNVQKWFHDRRLKAESHKCEYCEKVFDTRNELLSHVNSSHTVECSFCKGKFNQDKIKLHEAKCHNKSLNAVSLENYKCNYCDMKFSAQEQLKLHVAICVHKGLNNDVNISDERFLKLKCQTCKICLITK